MFNLEGFVPKLCQLAQEIGDDGRALSLRSAGLQALSAMVFVSFFCNCFSDVVIMFPLGWLAEKERKNCDF